MKFGARLQKDGSCIFSIYAPLKKSVKLCLKNKKELLLDMDKDKFGVWEITVKNIKAGEQYKFVVDGIEIPDPCSKYQMDGVHGYSTIIDYEKFELSLSNNRWKNIPLSEYIIYELHIGAFTKEGTFKSAIDRLDYLLELGITAIEIMPVAQCPGKRNWGYDGVLPYSVQNSYGTPDDFFLLIGECHKRNIAVILDVVYNHLGPEGNYIWLLDVFFTDKYRTLWGNSINYDGKYSGLVRDFFIENAVYWFKYFDIDGLRLDAIHSIYDLSANHFLKELRERVDILQDEVGKNFYLIAESELNDTRILEPYDKNGFNLDSQWLDDFHHSIHTLLTGEQNGFYIDFIGIDKLSKSYNSGFVYTGEYSDFRKRKHGSKSKDFDFSKFVVFSQNHDMVGNRFLGERLCHIVDFEKTKLAAGSILLSPYIPLLFMGEEFCTSSPFLYFINHTDQELVENVRNGRKEEFKDYITDSTDFIDPQSEDTFIRSKINWNDIDNKKNRILFDFYKLLIKLRKSGYGFNNTNRKNISSKVVNNNILIVEKNDEKGKFKLIQILNFGESLYQYKTKKKTEILVDSSLEEWLGSKNENKNIIDGGNAINIFPCSFILYKTD